MRGFKFQEVPSPHKVCPHCDNSVRFHARHEKNAEKVYLRVKEGRRKPERATSASSRILWLAVAHFDRAIAIIEEDTGLKFTRGFCRHLIENYLSASGHLFCDANFHNIPWMLGRCMQAKSLIQQTIRDNDALKQAIRADVPKGALSEDGQLVRVEKNFYKLGCFFAGHGLVEVGDKLFQDVIEFRVFGAKDNIIYRKTLIIDPNRFQKLCEEKKGRNQTHLRIAREALAHYPDLEKLFIKV